MIIRNKFFLVSDKEDKLVTYNKKKISAGFYYLLLLEYNLIHSINKLALNFLFYRQYLSKFNWKSKKSTYI